jgi:hypothetical protein
MAAALKQLDEVVHKQEKYFQEQEWLKYHVLIDIAVKVLKKEGKRVLLYGGAAINSLLPKESKFYDPNELMDLDVYTTDKMTLFETLKAAYVKAGYPLVNIFPAMNENTYKVQVEGMLVLDVHVLSKSYFDYLFKGSKVGDLGIRCTSVDYLRYTFYKQLSEPMTAYRWKKVFERLMIFNKVYPPLSQCNQDTSHILTPVEEETYKKLYAYIKTTPYLLLAADVFMIAAGDTKRAPSRMPIRILVDENEEKVVQEFLHRFSELNLKAKCNTYKLTDDGEVKVCTFTMNKLPLLYIHFTNMRCISYVSYNGTRVASLPTLIRYYTHIAFIHHRESSDQLKSTECLIHLLIALHLKSIRSKSLQQQGLFKQFITDCYGTEAGLITRKRNRLVKLLKKKYGESVYLELLH